MSVVADITGIASFIITIVLLFKSEAIRKELNFQKSDYIKEQKDIKIKLSALRDNIWKDELLTMPIKSQLRTELFKYQQKFSRLLSIKDRWLIGKTIKILDIKLDLIDKESLCKKIDYLIARFDKKEVTK